MIEFYEITAHSDVRFLNITLSLLQINNAVAYNVSITIGCEWLDYTEDTDRWELEHQGSIKVRVVYTHIIFRDDMKFKRSTSDHDPRNPTNSVQHKNPTSRQYTKRDRGGGGASAQLT